jgi:hypothetical protein
VTVPEATPVASPVALTVVIEVLLLLHVPPEIGLVIETTDATQSEDGAIEEDNALTVSRRETTQPVGSV